MKMFLISDNVDSMTGLRLAGVDGVVVHTREEFEAAVKKARSDKELGILLLTEKFGVDFPDLVSDLKLGTTMPLIVEIPDRHGTGRQSNFITAFVNEAIGLKL